MKNYTRTLPLYATSSENLATTASSGGGAAALVTLAAPGSTIMRRYVSDVVASYTTAPSSGGLKIYDGSSTQTTMLDIDIVTAGPHVLSLPLAATPGRKIVVELLQGGSSVIGKLAAYGDLAG